jgi:hypothetical protein
MERLWDKAVVMHAGDFRLKDNQPVHSLFQVGVCATCTRACACMRCC